MILFASFLVQSFAVEGLGATHRSVVANHFSHDFLWAKLVLGLPSSCGGGFFGEPTYRFDPLPLFLGRRLHDVYTAAQADHLGAACHSSFGRLDGGLP